MRRKARELWEKAGRRIPTPVEEIAASHDIQIVRQDLRELNDVSGALVFDGRKSFIGVNDSDSKVRQRFTIGHELGHFLLHPRLDRYDEVMLRNGLSTQGSDPREIEANVFAAELLMPASDLKERIGDREYIDESFVRMLAEQYQVSRMAMTVRLTSLGYLEM